MSTKKALIKLKHIALRYKHAVWLLLLPVYLILFFFAEATVTSEYWASYTPLDDKIPFVPEFAIFYYLWFPSLYSVGLYLFFKDPAGFKRYIWSIMAGFITSSLFFLVFPNGQNLRPKFFSDNDIFTRAVQAMYAIDTNTNVLPSMHVIGAAVMLFAVFDCAALKSLWIRVPSVVAAVLINLSTVFIKQHSVLDIYAGLAYSGILYIIFYVFVKKRQTLKYVVRDSKPTEPRTAARSPSGGLLPPRN